MSKILIIFLLMTTIVIGSATADNRFPIVGYQDFYNMDAATFYAYLDTFALSHYMTFIADSAGKYKEEYGMNVHFYTHHWVDTSGQRIVLVDSLDLDLNLANRSLFCAMASAAFDPVKGYRRNTSEQVGIGLTDGSQPVRAAFVSTHDAGLLHPSFDLGTFMYTSHGGQKPRSTVWDLTYSAELRLLDTTGNNGSVVAKLIFENRRSDACSTSSSPYSVYRYNDTLLCRYESGSYVCYPTIDRSASASEKRVVVSYCEVDTVKEDRRDITNVCYVDTTGDTICTVPYRFVRDVIDTEFVDPSTYYSIDMQVIGKAGWPELFNYKVYWTDVKDMYLDSLHFYDVNGMVYDSLVTHARADVVDSIEAWYTSHTLANGQIAGFRPLDEPIGPEMQNQRRMRSVATDISAYGTPKSLLSTLGAYNHPSTSAIRGQYFDTYVEYADTTHFLFDYYQLRGYVSSSSNRDDFSNVQCMLDWYADYYSLAKERADAISLQRNTQTDYWVVLPTFDDWRFVPGTAPDSEFYQLQRMPTGNEVRALVNLALSYGAKGIGYWPYIGHVNADKSAGQGYDMASPDTIALIDPPCSGAPDTPTEYCDSTACPDCADCVEGRPARNALVYRDSGEPYGIWWDVRDVNLYLDSMAYFFNNATWRSAGPASTVSTLSNSFIDSIKTLDTRFANDSAFIEVSFFTHSNESYAYVVNRRVDDGTYDWVDSQTVKIFMPGEGAYEVWDAYKNNYDTLWDSSGVLQWSRHLEPGGAVLLKSSALKTTWSGTVGSQWYWTIPAYATINMTGDITVPYGDTFTIDRARFKVAANSDDQSSGQSTTKSEFQVSGTLRVIGSGSSRPVLGPASASDSSWYGISAYIYGQIIMDNAVIRNAYRGIYLSGYKSDTVKNCRFEDCFMYGIYTRSDSSYIYQDTFVTVNGTSEGHGIYSKWSDAPAAISDCYFEDIKYPIRIWAANAPISNCEFRTTEFSGTSGTPAITFDTHGDPTITSCDIYGYGKGLQLAANSDVTVLGSSFQNVDTDDRMYVAISGAPSVSSLYARDNCFMSAWDTYVEAHKTTCDLGDTTWLDGNNSFNSALEFFKSAKDIPDTNIVPPFAIVNDSSVSIMAWYDYWMTRSQVGINSPGDWVQGPVNISAATYPDISWDCSGKQGSAPVASLSSNTETLPDRFVLEQNYPNPFNMSTVIPFSVPYAAQVKVEIFNVLGQRIASLWSGWLEAGEHAVTWDGKSTSGNDVSSGVYFYRMQSGDVVLSRKMVVLK